MQVTSHGKPSVLKRGIVDAAAELVDPQVQTPEFRIDLLTTVRLKLQGRYGGRRRSARSTGTTKETNRNEYGCYENVLHVCDPWIKL